MNYIQTRDSLSKSMSHLEFAITHLSMIEGSERFTSVLSAQMTELEAELIDIVKNEKSFQPALAASKKV